LALGSFVLGSRDVSAAEMEQVIDLVVGCKEPLLVAGSGSA